jgi:FlaA1/EpsC-like NDP-sugar epimerase
MGEPVRIMDLAEQMIELSGHVPGRDIAIEVVGIRPGEKLHEELFNVDEEVRPTRYGKIRRVTRPALDPDSLSEGLAALRRCIADGRSDEMADILWTTLRAGRSAAGGDESEMTPPSTSKETSP